MTPEPTRPAVRVLLVDDHEVVRQGLRLLLETALGLTVDEAGSGPQALAQAREHRPDVVLLDARMPEHDGIWTLRALRDAHPDLPVIMLSTYDSSEYVEGAITHGAAGYLLKDASSDQLLEAIRTATTDSGLYLHPQVAQRLLGRHADVVSQPDLSLREQEVLTALVAGHSTDDIGTRLHLAPTTVKTHLTSIFRKLGVANRTQAVAKALREGLVDDD
ncbi:MAG: response regulator transcription factor [Nitriliruptoraceae bacterium]